MCVRLRSLGIPKPVADEMISVIQRWHRCSGPEWTVRRLKNLKVEFLNRMSGGSYRAPDFRRNREGLPKGIWTWLFRKGLSGKAWMAIQCLMAYSVTVLEHPSKAQKWKFLGSMMSSDQKGMTHCPLLSHTLRRSVDSIPRPRPLFAVLGSPTKRCPDSDGKSIPQSESVAHSVAVLHHINWLLDHVEQNHGWEASESVGNLLETVFPWQELIGVVNLEEPKHHFVGKISLIQEPGCKLRAVANPHFVYQVALEPLKNILLDYLRELPTDCTHDQDSGKQVIQQWLKAGRTCHSVDLSDATNLFPRNFQLKVLKDLRGRDDVLLWENESYSSYVYLFETLSSLPWLLPKEMGGYPASFTRGQPLGLGPSFPCFALAHNTLLMDLCYLHGINPVDSFRILGDDIVIANDNLAQEYRNTLCNLGCLISEDKCLTSNKVAEFGGSIITRGEIIPQYKWREPSWTNVLSLCRNYGPSSLGFLSQSQKSVVRLLSPIPEMLGGLGWNPLGLPLSQRLNTPGGGYLLDKYLAKDDTVLVPAIAVKRRCSDWEVGITKWLDEVQSQSENFVDIRYFAQPLDRPDRGWFWVWLNTYHPDYSGMLRLEHVPDLCKLPLSPEDVTRGRFTRDGMEYLVRQPDGWSDPRNKGDLFLLSFVSAMIQDATPEDRDKLIHAHRQLFLRRKRTLSRQPSRGTNPRSKATQVRKTFRTR